VEKYLVFSEIFQFLLHYILVASHVAGWQLQTFYLFQLLTFLYRLIDFFKHKLYLWKFHTKIKAFLVEILSFVMLHIPFTLYRWSTRNVFISVWNFHEYSFSLSALTLHFFILKILSHHIIVAGKQLCRQHVLCCETETKTKRSRRLSTFRKIS